MQNKANFKTEDRKQKLEDRKKKTAKSGLTKDYGNEHLCSAYSAEVAAKAGSQKQTQSKPVSVYPCVFELAEYNLVVSDGNVMHSMLNGKNFDGEYMKWQMHRRQMQW